MIANIYLRLKLFIDKHVKIVDAETAPFFSQPNPFNPTTIYLLYTRNHILRINLTSPYSRLHSGIVDDKAQFIVFSTPKVSSTTIRVFAQEKLNLSYEKGHPHRVKYKTLINNTDTKKGLPTQINFKKYKDYKMFIIMRDPTERIISFFVDKILTKINNNEPESRLVAKNRIHMIFKNKSGIENNELTFKNIIDAFVFQYHNYGKISDVHLAPQITADLKTAAQNQLQTVRMEDCNAFLNYWHFESTGTTAQYNDHHNKSWNKEGSKLIPEGYNVKIKDLLLHQQSIHPDSFLYPELISTMKVIYKDDYEFWNNTKVFKEA